MQLWNERGELRAWQHVPVFLLAFAVVVSRRPDAIVRAQFWAEDGHVWFADAYNLGWWQPLFRTQDGYFQTLPRLAAGLALLVPLALAPLVLNLIAIVLQALPVNLLLATRSSAWGGLWRRAWMAAIYLALPNSAEMNCGITQSQWLLAFCAFLLLIAAEPESYSGRIFDVCLMALCGLSGPFCFFLAPIAVLVALRQRTRWRWAGAALLSFFCLVQAWGLLVVDARGRAPAPLGANPELFARILGGQVYVAALIGRNAIGALPGTGMFFFLLWMALAGTAMVAMCFARSTAPMRLLIVFAAMVFAASLASPAAYPPPGITRWQMLVGAAAIRYWFFPTLTFAWSLLWCIEQKSPGWKVLGGYLLMILCFGVVHDWRNPLFQDLNFARDATRIESAPVGATFTLPLNPRGWTMRLVKHRPGS